MYTKHFCHNVASILFTMLYSFSFSSSCVDAEEQSEVFRISPESGLLKPLEHAVPSCRQALEISFTARYLNLT